MKKMKIKSDKNQDFSFKTYHKKRRKKPISSNAIILLIFLISLIFFLIGLIMGRYLFQKKNIFL